MLISFGTKAETLEQLRSTVQLSIILPQVRFTAGDWQRSKEKCLERVLSELGAGASFIVRSSSISEDSQGQSLAGKFQSILEVPPTPAALAQAVDKVIESFGTAAGDENQIFIQPYIHNVTLSGVVFTRDLDTLAPYYVVNYDDHSSRTDSVTAGKTNALKTLIKFRDIPTRFKRFESLFAAISELETILQSDALDIEFAVDKGGKVYTFQVRPIVLNGRTLPKSTEIARYLQKIYKKVEKLNTPHPYLYGERTLLGIMPDWNPAEMIGVKPRPLALSLYKHLITDRTWAYQRDNYGYKNLRSYPLLTTFIGHPYVDVRVSASSFIPKDADEKLSNHLADYYLGKLEENPESHDKIEFDIILSCYFFNIEKRFKDLESAGFNAKEIKDLKDALLRLTNNILGPLNGVFETDFKKIEELKVRQEKVLQSSLTDLEKIYWLMEDCCRYGTLPFAGLARAAFIAVQILRSLVDIRFLTQEELDQFMASLNTVAKQMAVDRHKLSSENFLQRYGHLRPGTYDILSARYDEAYDLYFGEKTAPDGTEPGFQLSGAKIKELDGLLKKNGLAVSAERLWDFLKRAIEGREYSKFVFTKSVSEVLKLVRELAFRYNLSVQDASFIDIRTLMQLYSSVDHRDLLDILREEIDRNRHFYEFTKLMRLPPLIVHPQDIYEFELAEGSPNFITLGRCQAEVVGNTGLLKESLNGKIVFIPSADPGYDWVFTKNIVGLVTMYGGANSHMAIRAAELRIPAVIGAGEKNYALWSKAKVLEIDSANKQVRVLQ